MNGEQISLVGEIRLLGLTIDRNLTFIFHVAKACKKTANICKGLSEQPWRRGLESGSREDHIRDGNIADVRFVRLGTDDRETRRTKDALRRYARYSVASLLRRDGFTALSPAFCADPLEADPYRY
ncbi:hypothetical protein EVAR_101071_1 [Eumeta japonica]|uniref:Uncharacterized protein n=1 Tax=Eumeta variegata TaxID=151549 RepID=A0A4C1SKG8_EUMVA|nr:hypothetical protein EVAR_101071_1 [Eumeta japonica]